MAKVHQEVTSYVLIDWMGGPDGKIFGSRSGQHQMCVLAESQILSGPALPTIDDTQLGSHCSDTCRCLFQCCSEMVFWWTCPSSRPTLGGKGKRGRAQHVKVIPSIDPSSNVMDCSSVNKHFIIWNLCFWIFFDGAKTHSWQHLPRFARAFLSRVVRVFSALSLDAYRPHMELFSQGFPTKLRAGTSHMISNGNRTEGSPIRSVIITITKLSNLIGYQLPWFQPLLHRLWNHWLSVQSDWLSAVWFIPKSHHFLL